METERQLTCKPFQSRELLLPAYLKCTPTKAVFADFCLKTELKRLLMKSETKKAQKFWAQENLKNYTPNPLAFLSGLAL